MTIGSATVTRYLWLGFLLSSVAAGLGGCGEQGQGVGKARVQPVHATVETEPVPHNGDAADDPAIWIHPFRRARSTIIGTDKKGGIAVYALGGRQIQYRADGDLNNVDLRPGFRLGRRSVALVTAGNRSDNAIEIYRVAIRTRRLVSMSARAIHPGISTYGSCMYRSARNGRVYYFVTSKSGGVEQWELFASASAKVDARRVRSFDVGSQSEGCVADDLRGLLYVAEEGKGIWRYGAEPGAGTQRVLVDSTGARGHLASDVEGLTIARTRRGGGYLIASSQGDSSFSVYRRQGANPFVKSFRIGFGSGVDAVESADGIDVTTTSLGPAFPNGVFVAHDGHNDQGNQNYKLVPWQRIVAGG
jgi:3-phytase